VHSLSIGRVVMSVDRTLQATQDTMHALWLTRKAEADAQHYVCLTPIGYRKQQSAMITAVEGRVSRS
jgi:hypothetical protein